MTTFMFSIDGPQIINGYDRGVRYMPKLCQPGHSFFIDNTNIVIFRNKSKTTKHSFNGFINMDYKEEEKPTKAKENGRECDTKDESLSKFDVTYF